MPAVVGAAQGPDLLAAIREQARSGATAIRSAGRGLDYASMLATAERWAAALHAAGMQRGDVIAMIAERDPETWTLVLAILIGAGACLPLDTSYPPVRLGAMLEDAKPRLLLADAPMAATLPELAATTRCSRRELEERSIGLAVLPPPSAPSADALIYVLFTSGSSGRPKGVAMRSQVLAHLIAWHVAHPRLGRPARTLQFAPLGFDVAFQEMLSTFATGGSLVLPSDAERRDPYALLSLLVREGVERVFLPYVALQALAEAVAAGGERPLGLRDIVTAGEQLRITPAIRELFAALPDSVLHNHYGPTEAHVVTAHELSGDPAAWPELPPIGRPLPHVQVRLVDAAWHDVAPGEEGELLLGGDCLAAGYIHRPELTAERFIERDGKRWYRTGDRVRDQGDGVLACMGRLDEQIKLDGYRIEPAEIEAALCRHPAVAEAAVVVVAEVQGQRLVAHVVPRDARADDATLVAELRRHCETQLAAYLVPQAFVVLPVLPLTASGKIDRRTLAQGGGNTVLVWPEGVSLEQQLTTLWQQLLGISKLDAQDNLFDLGARSLTVVRALTELRRRGFRTLSAVQIYEHPNVAKLAALLTATEAAIQPDGAQARGDRQREALARFGPPPGGLR